MFATSLWRCIHVSKICNPLAVYRFKCMALYHSQTRRNMRKKKLYNTGKPSTFRLLLNPLYYFVTNIHVIDDRSGRVFGLR